MKKTNKQTKTELINVKQEDPKYKNEEQTGSILDILKIVVPKLTCSFHAILIKKKY